ncbi:DUF6092 family protein [Thalassobacillus devorans]|uniref:DUF6092 family protein n=1 Tax=Thalassobacillus devorans TaxID=279813 RepID=UPI000A1CB8FA|nr:DUF6092 family protein [Thalassobacillus devorans]
MKNTVDNNISSEESKEGLLDFVSYVLTSTRGLYREPHSYGPMRMIDTLEKALQLLKEQGLAHESLDEVMKEVRQNRWQATSDPEAFAKSLDASINQLVKLTKAQN